MKITWILLAALAVFSGCSADQEQLKSVDKLFRQFAQIFLNVRPNYGHALYDQFNAFQQNLLDLRDYFNFRLSLISDKRCVRYLKPAIERLTKQQIDIKVLTDNLNELHAATEFAIVDHREAILGTWQLWYDDQLERAEALGADEEALANVAMVLSQYKLDHEIRLEQCIRAYEAPIYVFETELNEFLSTLQPALEELIRSMESCLLKNNRRCNSNINRALKPFRDIDRTVKKLIPKFKNLIDRTPSIGNDKCVAGVTEDFEYNKPIVVDKSVSEDFMANSRDLQENQTSSK